MRQAARMLLTVAQRPDELSIAVRMAAAAMALPVVKANLTSQIRVEITVWMEARAHKVILRERAAVIARVTTESALRPWKMAAAMVEVTPLKAVPLTSGMTTYLA